MSLAATVITVVPMKLFRSPDSKVWVGEDAAGALMMWAREPGGWSKRTAYTGQRRALEEVAPSLARGTGWPGGGRGPRPRVEGERSERRVALRATNAEVETWERRAAQEGKALATWGRDELNEAVKRPRRK